MRDASVGFHCPECVAEGTKAIPRERTAYGVRSDNPMITSMVLIGINVAVWVLIIATGGAASRWVGVLAIKLGGYCQQDTRVPEQICDIGGLTWVDGVDTGAYWQLMTSVFTHVDALHIAFNMFALYLLGPQLESMIGRARFLAIYLLSGLGGSVAVLWLSEPYASTVGASGAIFGLMAALAVVIWKRGGNPQPILIWIAINVLITFTGRGISWQGHLGGFLTGLAIALVLVYAPREDRTRYQVAGMSAIGVLLVLAVFARTATFA